MLQPYKTILAPGQDEYVIQRSRFIGYAQPVQAEEEALAFIEGIRKKHWDAAHNVWAYVIGMDGQIQRCSDDGEPQGTAGKPTLEVIRKEGLVNVAVVVTRYFGGIKLGAGGLVRAYTQGAKIGLAAGGLIQRLPYATYRLQTDYSLIGKFQREFEQRGYLIQDVLYTDKVQFHVLVPMDEKDRFLELVTELTAGQGDFTQGDDTYVNFQNDIML
ncbi:MAG TPA: YigZ family protein [Peptococcaceae bacterium]|nr:YigZ family protein [Peptococcaceae bacterium]